MGDLRTKTGLSAAHLRRLAHAGVIPGAMKITGRHFRFRDCPALRRWIKETQSRHTKEGLVIRPRRPVEPNDVGCPSLLELARQFARDYFAFTRSHDVPSALAAEVANILRRAIEDIDSRQNRS